MSGAWPSEGRALLLERHDPDCATAIRGLRVARRPVPHPRRGQVLVRIEAAPCNPSDLLFLQGRYGVSKTLPAVPGWEGAGTVIASGGGWLARRLVGRRVACGGQMDSDGTWAEYYVVQAAGCVPLSRGVDIERGATLLINPLTAIALLDLARRARARAALQTAAASQVGRMVVQLAREARLPLVNVVRRPEQVELLRSMGARHVLDSSAAGFEEELRRLGAELGVTVIFEAVAGEMTGRLLGCLPRGTRAVVYGALSEAACSAIDPIGLIFHGKRVEGFYLGAWVRGRGLLRTLRDVARVQRLVSAGELETPIQRVVGLDDAVDGLLQYRLGMTAGKILIRPWLGRAPDSRYL